MRFSDDSNLRARIVRHYEDFDSRDSNRWMDTRRELLIVARTRLPDFQPKRSCRLLLTISSLDSRIRRRASTYNVTKRNAHSSGSKLPIAQASEASRLSNFAPTPADDSATHDSPCLSTSFASRAQSNFVISSTRNRDY